ncbi:MAG: 3-hydroxyacyl-CoA dehydrogenase [Bacillaceae bacterium]
MELNKVVAIVTGGASGLGEAVCRHIISKGGKVCILDLQEEKGITFVEELGKENSLFIKTDVTDEASVSKAINGAIEKFGKINVAVNCAGIVIAKKVLSKRGIHDLSSFEKVLRVNVAGTFNVIRLAVEQMAKNEQNTGGERGVIINTASIAAFDGQVGQAAYSASKGAIVGMTLPLAREFAQHGIRVMAIAPGVFYTPMFDVLPEKAQEELAAKVPFPSRLGNPAEYAQLAESIITNGMLNGEVIRLDGALRMQ